MQNPNDQVLDLPPENQRPLELLRSRAIFAIRIFLLIYFPYTCVQAVGSYFFGNPGLINPGVMQIGNVVNWIMLGVAACFYGLNLLAVKRGKTPQNLFYLSLFGTTSVIASGLIIHLHFAGTQSSILLLLFLTTVIVVSWFMRWRDSLVLLILGNVAILTIMTLEYFGVLPYAPLIKQNHLLLPIFLDWRVVMMNLLIYLATMIIVLVILVNIRRTLFAYHRKINQSNDDLRQALAEVKRLKGLLPICSGCKKIRDDKGYWNQLEQYLHEYSDLEFTHSLCPDCVKKYFNEGFCETDDENS